ncbi:hypothetical protein ASG17_12495 [Brevundimonas sp. Leaf363]|uniref:AMP-binding protein n=1 Tax=Brevundimonas sp. Leaf363 TaxID=1736353 RepID=UPI0006FFF95C|nr:AMP-binding protein [Brevundimonas sp. Leaf363]KQS54440.1 hypothetical protein ASG17_12495 [Brevundimonas sp. Leaf363]
MNEPLSWATLDYWRRRKPADAAILTTAARPPLLWADLPGLIARIAEHLRMHGVAQSARIAIAMPPGAETALVTLAAMQCGVAAPLNPELTASELASSLRRLRPHVLIVREGLPGRPEAVAQSLGIPTLAAAWSIDEGPGGVRLTSAQARAVVGDDALAAPDGTRLILQTSGTTAEPKLVPLTEANLFASAAALMRSLSLTENDRALNLLSQFHIGGLWDLIAAPLFSGGSVICGGVFSVATYRAGCGLAPTWVQLAPSMIHAVVAAKAPAPPTLRFIRSVSAPLSMALKAEAQTHLGRPIIEIYGMTETAGVITSNPFNPAHQKPGSVGVPVGPTIAVLDPSGRPVPVGSSGEVVLRGPQVSPGYLAAAAGDAVVFAADGFHTGDLGRMDEDGHLWLVGRSKDLINRGGEMIGPAEIDAAALSLAWVADAAAFAAPHPTLGEEIEMAIVLKAGAQPQTDLEETLAATRDALRSLLGYGRMPARIHIVQAVPRTPGGKLQRHLLVEQFSGLPRVHAAPAADRAALAWPERPVARWVAGVWASVLDLAVMGADEDFFQSGGSSLQAAQAAALVQSRFPDQMLYVSSVYEAPTPDQQADFLSEHYPEITARILGETLRPDGGLTTLGEADQMRFARRVRDPLDAHIAGKRLNPPAVFILSPPRSGSTLLRAMMAGHDALFAPPELYLLSHADLTARRAWYGRAHASQLEGLPRAFMGATGCSADEAQAIVSEMERDNLPTADVYLRLQTAIGGRLLVDKTPYYGVHSSVLTSAEATFERPIYIHLSRHPYGMIRSFDQARLGQLWWPRLAGPDGDPVSPFASRQLAELIWTHIHANTVAFLEGVPAERQIHLRYEDLVRDPEAAARRLCATLGLPFDPAMLDPLADPSGRMTDGLRAESRMIGDPKFHSHSAIDPSAADQWKQTYDRDFLSSRAGALANALGHTERVDDADERVEFDV